MERTAEREQLREYSWERRAEREQWERRAERQVRGSWEAAEKTVLNLNKCRTDLIFSNFRTDLKLTKFGTDLNFTKFRTTLSIKFKLFKDLHHGESSAERGHWERTAERQMKGIWENILKYN